MNKQDKADDNLPKPQITRRAVLTLAAAVAAFGAAMGMRASTAWAQGKIEGKCEPEYGEFEGKMEGKFQGKMEGKFDGRMWGKFEGKREGKDDCD
ncbi:MAG: hypothetical protein ABSC63_01040 [Candidatus Binataceae bacterium]|jgi:hypothetical protein